MLRLTLDEYNQRLREEEEADFLDQLTRANWGFVGADYSRPAGTPPPAETELDEDPVARRLRQKVGIYHGRRQESFEFFPGVTPVVLSAEDAFGWEGRMRPAGWPETLREMKARLRRVIPLLRAKAHPFWDPAMAEWAAQKEITRIREEKMHKSAWLSFERWRNEDTYEELWVLVALMKPEWGPPTNAMRRALWRRVTGHDQEVEFEPQIRPFRF